MAEHETKAYRLIEQAAMEFDKHAKHGTGREHTLSHVLAPKCSDAAQELLDKGFPECAALVAALPVLFREYPEAEKPEPTCEIHGGAFEGVGRWGT